MRNASDIIVNHEVYQFVVFPGDDLQKSSLNLSDSNINEISLKK